MRVITPLLRLARLLARGARAWLRRPGFSAMPTRTEGVPDPVLARVAAVPAPEREMARDAAGAVAEMFTPIDRRADKALLAAPLLALSRQGVSIAAELTRGGGDGDIMISVAPDQPLTITRRPK